MSVDLDHIYSTVITAWWEHWVSYIDTEWLELPGWWCGVGWTPSSCP